jgi:diphthamide biosynthesis protein 3
MSVDHASAPAPAVSGDAAAATPAAPARKKREVVYDDVDLDEMQFDEAAETYYYPCPCGDRFSITIAELEAGDTIARCPSCSLIIRVLYDVVQETDEA